MNRRGGYRPRPLPRECDKRHTLLQSGSARGGIDPIVTEPDITGLLRAHVEGCADAMDDLLPAVYDELRAIAHRQLARRRPGATLNTTALVHEAYVKLVDQDRAAYKDQAHFFGVAATAMRHIIIDYAREQCAQKRGGKVHPVDLDSVQVGAEDQLDLLLMIDEGLNKLSDLNQRLTQVVECRYFAGLTERETAEALNVSRRTVQRDWLKARVLLKRHLTTG